MANSTGGVPARARSLSRTYWPHLDAERASLVDASPSSRLTRIIHQGLARSREAAVRRTKSGCSARNRPPSSLRR